MAKTSTPCFFLEPTQVVRLAARRIAWPECPKKGKGSCHHASVPIGEAAAVWNGDVLAARDLPHDDPRWPKACAACGYEFKPEDHWAPDQDLVYRRQDTGQLMTLDEAGAGAMWWAPWYADVWHGSDGRCLVVRIPARSGRGHDWIVDSRASNCTRPKDVHQCWIRTGEPPRVTAGKGKDPKATCTAGAGSIKTPDWHGFLTNGALVGKFE